MESEHFRQQKRLLQATVDSAVLSLSGVLAEQPDQIRGRALLAAALDALTFDLGAPVYFTAWEDTRLLHSPLTPDTEGLDFRDALDARGMAFIQALSDTLATGGGFLQVFLYRHVFDSRPAGRNTAFGLTVHTAGSFAPASADTILFSATFPSREEEEPRIVYTRLIPGSSWRISAFMSAPEGFPAVPASGVEGAASVWDIPRMRNDFPPEDLRAGMYVSGFSFLGLAGVLLLSRPGGRSMPGGKRGSARQGQALREEEGPVRC
jgi:hypothetical protein